MGTSNDNGAVGEALPIAHDPQRPNCQCARCKAVVANWHAVAEAEARGKEVLLLPHSTAGRLAVFNRSPWFNERKLMHLNVISAEEEATEIVRNLDKPGVEVKITEQRVEEVTESKRVPWYTGPSHSRYEIDIRELDNLLNEANGDSAPECPPESSGDAR